MSDHLLRTFAAVAPGTVVLDVAGGAPSPAVALAQLGLAVTHACRDAARAESLRAALEAAGVQADVLAADAAHLPLADDACAWVVACRVLDGYSEAEALALLAEWKRVLAPGGWLYLSVGADVRPEALAARAGRAGFEVAEAARVDPAERVTRGIFRRVDETTIR